MLKVNDLCGRKVYVPKKAKKSKKTGDAGELKVSKLGKVHMAVFSPNGREVVGFTVTRPDIVGMVKRADAFVAVDSFRVMDDGALLVTREDDGLDEAARERLGIDWDACVMWTGMDAQTVGGKKLGYVSDAEFNTSTGAVTKFYVGDGGVARALVGSFEIPAGMVRGYSKGRMLVDDEAAGLELDGGVAAKAGEGYAKAKVKGAEAAQKAGKAAGEAVDKGSFAFGRMLGRAKRAIEDATSDEEETSAATKKRETQAPAVPAADVRVSDPAPILRATDEERAQAPEPKVYAPADDSAKVASNDGDTAGKISSASASHGNAAQVKTSVKTGAKTGAKPASKNGASPAPKPKAAGKPAQAKNPAQPKAGATAAKAMGKQIGRMSKMFSSFKEEYDKASK